MLLHTYRNSVGDLQVKDYSFWADNADSDDLIFSSSVKKTIVAFIWIFWAADIYLILIIMLNLLIA
jgi:hypothetical protein